MNVMKGSSSSIVELLLLVRELVQKHLVGHRSLSFTLDHIMYKRQL